MKSKTVWESDIYKFRIEFIDESVVRLAPAPKDTSAVLVPSYETPLLGFFQTCGYLDEVIKWTGGACAASFLNLAVWLMECDAQAGTETATDRRHHRAAAR